jgi:hypothetical protein
MPGGTRPEATPPTTVPKKNGVRREDNANAAPKKRRMPSVATLFRYANAAPRAMIPKAARVSGR